jgi:hypothetical protein
MGAVGAIHELPLHTWRNPSIIGTGKTEIFNISEQSIDPKGVMTL